MTATEFPTRVGPEALAMERLERLLNEAAQSADPVALRRMQELVRAVMDFHEVGLQRMLALCRAEAPSLVERLAQDPLICSVLLAHGLHPRDAASRVHSAIDRIRLHLKEGAQLELVSLDEKTLRARLSSPSDHMRELTALVEQALCEAAPELQLQLESLTRLPVARAQP
jgi:hypothetical protein